MRRALALLVGTTFALAGCGSSGSPASSPLTGALSYFPSGSPFVMTIATKGISSGKLNQGLLKGIPFAGVGETAALSKLQQLGINYDADVRPLFGNPIVLGLAGDGTGPQVGKQFLLVWPTADASAVHTLIKKLAPNAASTGTRDGATLYTVGSAAFAVDGPTVLLGASPTVIATALDRHARSQGITPSEYAGDIAGLPKAAAVEAFGNLLGVLSRPSASAAKRVPWVSALRGYATTISADSGSVTFQYRVDTSGAQLTAAQLPFAGGSTAPSLAGSLPISAGLRDPAQVISFVLAAEQVADPKGYTRDARQLANLKRKIGVDLQGLLSLMSGDLILSSDTHTTLVRMQISDPSKAAQVLARGAGDSPDSGWRRAPGGGYLFRSGKRWLPLRLIGDQLVAGRATSAQLAAFAAAPATQASGARGALAFKIAVAPLIEMALKQKPASAESAVVERLLLSTLGDLSGWSAASPTALTGSATLAIK
jgi:hypothetical protein